MYITRYISMVNEKYWNDFYQNNNITTKQSNFAEFVLNFIKINCDKNITICDIGCGNGRDSYYFANNGYNTIGIDLCAKEQNLKNLKIYKQNIISNNLPEADVYYLRFFLHTLEEKDLNILLNILNKNKCLFFIETRSSKEYNTDKIITNFKSSEGEAHFRALYSKNYLENKLLNNNFNIIYSSEENNVAIHKEENPYVIRIICSK